jgi:hypothetical protein
MRSKKLAPTPQRRERPRDAGVEALDHPYKYCSQ